MIDWIESDDGSRAQQQQQQQASRATAAAAESMIDRQEQGRRLYLASIQGDTNQARELLMSGAPVDFVSVDENDQTPLIVASQNGHQEIVSMLLDFGASKDTRTRVRSFSLSLSFSLILSLSFSLSLSFLSLILIGAHECTV